MFNVSRSTGLYALLFCSGLLLTSQAYAFDLNGAWATGTDQCNQVFVKKGDKISFAQFSEEFGGGFVADGNDVRSKTVRCTIVSRKETGDTIDFHAACASEIMATSVDLRLKILDADSVSRIFPDPAFAGMELTFNRCSMYLLSRNSSAVTHNVIRSGPWASPVRLPTASRRHLPVALTVQCRPQSVAPIAVHPEASQGLCGSTASLRLPEVAGERRLAMVTLEM